MMKKKRVGVVLPPKDPSGNVIEGSGLMPDEVRNALIEGLGADLRIEEVAFIDLGRACVRNGEVWEGDLCLSELDLVHWYFVTHIPANWNIVVLRALAQRTRVVPDPEGLLRGLDKFYAHTALRNAGLPTADFTLFNASAVNEVASRLCQGKPLLLKPRLGCFGHGIHMVRTPREMIDAVQYSQSFSREPLQIFCEEFEENDIRKWISTTVIGGDLAYGYRKRPEKFVDNWKVYDPVRAGGGVDWADASAVRETALRAAKVLGCDIIGFDFIYSTARRKYLIVDENTFPGMYPECFDRSAGGSWDRHFLRMILAALEPFAETAKINIKSREAVSLL
jgi:glutathione synthase/RimK-type ligase-like ATP-grasp enzyme